MELHKELNCGKRISILQIDGKRKHDYKSLYFDTEDRKFYNDHHNQRVNRYKVRYREYVDSGLVFLEIKCKNNKGKTIKKRLMLLFYRILINLVLVPTPS